MVPAIQKNSPFGGLEPLSDKIVFFIKLSYTFASFLHTNTTKGTYMKYFLPISLTAISLLFFVPTKGMDSKGMDPKTEAFIERFTEKYIALGEELVKSKKTLEEKNATIAELTAENKELRAQLASTKVPKSAL